MKKPSIIACTLVLATLATSCGDPKTSIAIEKYDEFVAALPEDMKSNPKFNFDKLTESRDSFVTLANAYPDSALTGVYKLQFGFEMLKGMRDAFKQ